MFRTPIIAALAAALLGGTALAQPASAPPTSLSDSARSAPDYDDYAPPARAQSSQTAQTRSADDRARRDIFCRRDAAARTGYTTPREAARDEQVRGSIGGTLGGAALGAIIGGATGGNAGTGAAIGAGAGLLAGTAVGSSNARQAARDVEADYSDAYYACMNQDYRREAGYGAYDDDDYGPPPPPPAYAYGPPPPVYYGPAYYGPAYYGPGYYPYYGPSYGSSFSLNFGFGGGHRYHGGWRGRHR